MEIQDLVGFGMTKTEAVVYLEISKLGETQIGSIIKRTGLHRGTVYNSINNLIEKGFLSFMDKDRNRFYRISNKKIFEEIIKEKQTKAVKEKEQIEKFFEDLQKLKEKDENQEVRVFYGVKSFKTLFLEIYDNCKKNNYEYLFQGKGGEMQDATGEVFYKYTQKLKKKMNLKCRVILDKESQFLPYNKYTTGNIRYLPTKIPSPINFWIYGDNVLFVLFGAKPLISIKIKSKVLSEGFKNYFETIWKAIEGEQKIIKKRYIMNLYEFTQQAEDSLDMMGINCLTPVHESREKIIDLLKKGKRVRILLPNQKSKNFEKRVKIVDRFIKDINQSRVLYGLKCTIANLKDITLKLKNKYNLEIKLFDKKPICMVIIIDNKKALYNKYEKKKGEYASSQKTLILDKEDKEFKKAKDIFEEYWKSAKPLKI